MLASHETLGCGDFVADRVLIDQIIGQQVVEIAVARVEAHGLPIAIVVAVRRVSVGEQDRRIVSTPVVVECAACIVRY